MGPVSPATTPSSAGFSGCCVSLDCAIGDGFRNVNGFGLRAKTSKRGMGVEKSCTPKSGLDGKPVGIESAYALRTNGLNPCFMASTPPAVKRPHFRRSRREICPWDQALRISRRFLRAFSASLSRFLDALLERKNDMDTSPFAVGSSPMPAVWRDNQKNNTRPCGNLPQVDHQAFRRRKALLVPIRDQNASY